MGNNKIKFLSKEEINKIKERKLLKEENKKREKEKSNARHRRMYLRKKKRYLKMLEKEKEEEENKDKKKEEEEQLDKNLSKKEINKIIELKQIKEYYIGKEGPKIIKKKENKPKEMIRDFFVFDWKDTEDTNEEKKNYLPIMTPRIMFGKGMVGGLETKEDMKDYYNFNEKEKMKRIKYNLKKSKRKKSNSSSKEKSKSRSRSRSKDNEKEKKKEEEKKEKKNEKDKNDKDKKNEEIKKDKEQIKNEIKKRIMPKLNDGTKKFNWKDFNVIYKY